MHISIDIPDNKARAFIAFLKTIDFVKIKKNDTGFELSQKQKEELMQCYSDYKTNPSSFLSWDSVKNEIEKHL